MSHYVEFLVFLFSVTGTAIVTYSLKINIQRIGIYCWLIANVAAIVFFTSQSFYWLSLQNFIFLVFSIIGIVKRRAVDDAWTMKSYPDGLSIKELKRILDDCPDYLKNDIKSKVYMERRTGDKALVTQVWPHNRTLKGYDIILSSEELLQLVEDTILMHKNEL